MSRRQLARLFILVLTLSMVWMLFTEYAVMPILTEQKIQIFQSSEPQPPWKTLSMFRTFYTKAVDFAQSGNQTRFGVGGSYVLDRQVANNTIVIVEKLQVPLRIGGRSYVEVYEAEGPTLDGKILKGRLLASTPDFTKSLYLVTAISLTGLFGLTFIKRRKTLEDKA